jgi:hypothetical protein
MTVKKTVKKKFFFNIKKFTLKNYKTMEGIKRKKEREMRKKMKGKRASKRVVFIGKNSLNFKIVV